MCLACLFNLFLYWWVRLETPDDPPGLALHIGRFYGQLGTFIFLEVSTIVSFSFSIIDVMSLPCPFNLFLYLWVRLETPDDPPVWPYTLGGSMDSLELL